MNPAISEALSQRHVPLRRRRGCRGVGGGAEAAEDRGEALVALQHRRKGLEEINDTHLGTWG